MGAINGILMGVYAVVIIRVIGNTKIEFSKCFSIYFKQQKDFIQ